MAGRIRDVDIALVRERSPIAEVIGEHIQLRNAGGGNLKGLCPFHDEKSPSFNVTPERGMYFCLAGETRVLTWNGVRPIAELAGGVHRVLAADGTWVDAPFKSFGVQRLMRLTISRNGQTKDVFATPEHRWFIRAGRRQDKRAEVTTEDLKPGQRLVTVFPGTRIKRTTPSPFGIAHGIIYGDGTRAGTGSRATLDSVKDAQLLKWFPQSYVTETRAAASGNRQLLVHHLPRFFKELPPLEESVPYLYGWLAGYLAADGHVAKDGTVMLHCADRATLEYVRAVCSRLGIGTYGITEQVRIGFAGREPSSLYRVHFVNDDLTEDAFLLDEHRTRFTGAAKAYARRGWVVKSVEETERLEEVFCATVDHGHAFVLEDNLLTGNCFGCSEGGDVITFVEKIEHLGFGEAVERLAQRAGIQLQYEQGGYVPRRDHGERARLVEAHKAAAEFYAAKLLGPDAAVGRRFLSERGFERADAETFGVGFAPAEWEALARHLMGRGFTADELIKGGLVKEGRRGPIDRFRGRLIWPIRDATGDVIGFGARKLLDSDDGPKYLNTPESPLYKKSQVLYGIDLAKREISKRAQAVIVEGYTDVMACHLAGVPTAVATCGTSFGEEHIKILRRFLLDQAEFRGEVIFTFDGDAAGQKAALRAFADEQKFVTQTYVAVQADGLDPCDLRVKQGDAAVRDLIASREPLFQFALRNTVARYDLRSNEGKIAALDAAAPIVAAIKDVGLRKRYAIDLDRWLGFMDERFVMQRIAEVGGAQRGRPQPVRRAAPLDPGVRVEAELLKLAVQRPALLGPRFDALDPQAFTAPDHVTLHQVIAAAGGTAAAGHGGREWVDRLLEHALDEAARVLVTRFAVEAIQADSHTEERYGAAMLAAIEAIAIDRAIAQVKSRIQRLNPVDEQQEYNRLFGELVALEQQRRVLRDRAAGS
ncbi:DNA primase [Nonomuraea cavernae]|uniref:DNA primase n=1 Tax=Nonomuraea cavernae TaxID=2045107 RepID=UPI0016643A85|nr:DNA primase [Nonomuraea cavernae]MCA2185436.1 DNA primase [Nonomuraea cavernae]